MLTKWLAAMVLGVSLAALVGCGGKQKDDDKPPPATDPNDKKQPDGETPTPAPNEPKFKLTAKEFIAEYTKSGRGADHKYGNQIVELKGVVFRSATVEADAFGNAIGSAGNYKAMFVFGEENAKRVETVEVKGLKLSVVGTIFQRREVRVKGKVARYSPTNPMQLLDSEVIDSGRDTSIALDYRKLYPPDGREYAKQFEEAPARVTGMVLNRGKDVSEYVTLKMDDKDQLRCYLIEGTDLLSPSVFKEGGTVTLVGILMMDTIDKGTPFVDRKLVLRDAVAKPDKGKD